MANLTPAPDMGVDVRCNKCGEVMSFWPSRVISLRPCECGNDNYGRPSKWADKQFGDFTFIGNWTIEMPSGGMLWP